MSDDYPSPREALFGNGHTENLYCAAKWLMWHGIHLFLVAFWGGALAFVALIALIFFLLELTEWVFLRTVRPIVMLIEWWAPQTAVVATKVRTVAKGSEDRPIRQRIYGECPVSIKTDPKWYGTFKRLLEALAADDGEDSA